MRFLGKTLPHKMSEVRLTLFCQSCKVISRERYRPETVSISLHRWDGMKNEPRSRHCLCLDSAAGSSQNDVTLVLSFLSMLLARFGFSRFPLSSLSCFKQDFCCSAVEIYGLFHWLFSINCFSSKRTEGREPTNKLLHFIHQANCNLCLSYQQLSSSSRQRKFGLFPPIVEAFVVDSIIGSCRSLAFPFNAFAVFN